MEAESSLQNIDLAGAPIHRVMRSLAKVIAGCVLVAFVCFQLKGCVGHIWAPWREIRQFAIIGADQRILDIHFFPDWRVIFLYRDPSNGLLEASLAQVRGTMGTHYAAGLWHIEGPSIGFGYRWYPKGCQPYMMEIDTLKKHHVGIGSPVFPDEKERTYSEIVFCPNRVMFHKMELTAVFADGTKATALKKLLESSSSP
jgi:hypothetical protein